MELLQRVAAELGRFTFAGGPPSLQIKFTGDLAQMENARVAATLSGERMQRGPYEIKAFSAAGDWSEQKLNLTQLEWTDAAGIFASRATWNALTSEAEFQVAQLGEREAIPRGFRLRQSPGGCQLFPLRQTWSFPALAISRPPLPICRRSAESQPRILPTKVCRSSAWRQIFPGMAHRTMLREVKVRHDSGELLADFLDAPGDFRLNLESSLNPTAFRALASGDLRQFLSEWEWPRSPAVRLALHGTSREPQSWKGEGTIAVQRTRFRGVWMNSASARVHFADGAITFNDLRVVRDEGVGTGAFTYDPVQHEVRIDHVKTTLRPADAIYWIEPKLHKVVTPYKFRAPPALTANGLVQYRGGKNTRLAITIDAPTGLDYVFLDKTLAFDRARGNLLITDERVQLSEVEGTLFGGTVRGSADISVAKEDPRYSAKVALERRRFSAPDRSLFQITNGPRTTFRARTISRVWATMRARCTGAGKIKVANGDVFAIPVFGPLSGLISAVIPGAGYSVAKQATASFTIKEGVIRTEDFKVSGKLFGMLGHGNIHFLDNKLDFDIRINAEGPGVLLTPGLQAFRIQRRRQALETELASETILETRNADLGTRKENDCKEETRDARVGSRFRAPHSAFRASPRRAHVDRRRRASRD